MGRRLVEELDNKWSSPRRSKLITQEAIIHATEERTCRLERAGTSFKDGNDGGLPLFFPTASESTSFRLGRLNPGGVSLKHADQAGWPLGSEEIAAWASSFHFELDSGDDEKLRAILLERDARITSTCRERKHDDSRYLTELGTPGGGSFRFVLSGNRSGHLKPPRQLEKIHGQANRLGNACGNERQGCHGVRPSDGLSVGVARIKVAVNDHASTSPGRSEILRRLNDLKAHPLSPRFLTEDVAVSYHRGKGKMAAVRDDFHRRLKTSSPLLGDECSGKGSSSPASPYQKNVALGELQISPSSLRERGKQSNSPSGFRASPRIAAQLASQSHPITPTSRLRNCDRHLAPRSTIHEQIVTIRKQPALTAASNVNNSPSPEHALSVPAAIPFKWEEEPGKPKTIAAAAHRALARRLPSEGVEMSNCIMELKSGSQSKEGFKPPGAAEQLESENSGNVGNTEAPTRSESNTGDPVERSGSYRYYGRSYLSKHSREGSLGRSSRRYSTQEKEAHIDLDASAAARFLAFELSPSSSPNPHASSSPTNVAVPFKWEAAPGKAKVETAVRSPGLLQLPPRLAVPSCRSAGSFARELRASHPFAGFFSPCLTASSPGNRKQSARALMQYTPSKSLPPRAPGTPSRLKRHGFVGRCSSAPREGCHIRASKSFEDRASSHGSSNWHDLSTGSSPGLKPRTLFLSELKGSINAPASPTSILCGPDESSSQTSTSNTAFSSGDLEDFTRQRNRSRQSVSKSSSSASYESIEHDFAELPSPPPSKPHHFRESQPGKPSDTRKTPDKLGTTRTLVNSSPALSNYFQSLELTEATTPASTEDVLLLDKRGAPTSSGYLNTDGEPVALGEAFPALQSEAIIPSPKRATRLPYTMPSAAEQFLASCSTSGRRQLIQDLSPRLLRQYSGKKTLSASHSGSTTPRVDHRHRASTPRHATEQMSPSPAYAASLDIFSPAANIIAQRRKWPATPLAKAPPNLKPRRRSRLMLSICKTLKRVLGRQRRHKPIEAARPRLVYHDKPASPMLRFKTTFT